MQSKLDKLLNMCAASGIFLEKSKLPANIKAIYYSDQSTAPVITIDTSVNTQIEEACILAEELGHHITSCGNLLTDSDIHKTIIIKQEQAARRWAFNEMISFSDLIDAHLAGCRTIHEVAEHLGITEAFLRDAVKVYEHVYGLYIVKNGFRIYFDPLWVVREEDMHEDQSS